MTFDNNKPEELTDEEFCDLLLSHDTASSSADTSGADTLKQALVSYRTEALDWAERRSATMPSLAPAAKRRGWLAAAPQWSLAAVAAVTVVLGVAHMKNSPTETAAVDAPAAISSMETASTPQQQIAQDNALLNSIDVALDAGSAVPAQSAAALGLRPAGGEAHRYGSME